MDATALTVWGSAGPPEAALKPKPMPRKATLISSHITLQETLACVCFKQNRWRFQPVPTCTQACDTTQCHFVP